MLAFLYLVWFRSGGIFTDTSKFFVELDRQLLRDLSVVKPFWINPPVSANGKLPNQDIDKGHIKALKGLDYMKGIEEPSSLKGGSIRNPIKCLVDTIFTFQLMDRKQTLSILQEIIYIIGPCRGPKPFPIRIIRATVFCKAELLKDGSVVASYGEGGIIKK